MTTSANLDLLIVIVCYRVPELTTACLESLIPELNDNPRVHVAVCENGTGRSSEAYLRNAIDSRGLSERVTLFVTPINQGFSGGNNLVLKETVSKDAYPRYVLLLNADTVVMPGCIDHCLKLLNSNPNIGALSCKLLNADGSIQNTARKFPTLPRAIASSLGLHCRFPRLFGWADTEDPSWDRNCEREVDWLGGAALWLRGEWLLEHGFLDEDFSFYGEDIEICHRIRKTGFNCHYTPHASILHYGASSNDPVLWPDKIRMTNAWKARYLVQKKCYGTIACRLLSFTDLMTWRLRLLKRRITSSTDPAKYQEAIAVVQLLSKGVNAC